MRHYFWFRADGSIGGYANGAMDGIDPTAPDVTEAEVTTRRATRAAAAAALSTAEAEVLRCRIARAAAKTHEEAAAADKGAEEATAAVAKATAEEATAAAALARMEHAWAVKKAHQVENPEFAGWHVFDCDCTDYGDCCCAHEQADGCIVRAGALVGKPAAGFYLSAPGVPETPLADDQGTAENPVVAAPGTAITLRMVARGLDGLPVRVRGGGLMRTKEHGTRTPKANGGGDDEVVLALTAPAHGSVGSVVLGGVRVKVRRIFVEGWNGTDGLAL